MTNEQRQAILTIAMLAAFADGVNDDSEREQIRRLAENIAGEAGAPDVTALYQKVLLGQVRLADAAALLVEPAYKQLAYEMAVCVCDADGQRVEAERAFLAELSAALGLSGAQTAPVEQEVAAMAEVAREAAPLAPTVSGGVAPGAIPAVSDAEMERTILNAAILNGALELLPQSWASLAIIPLQVRLVYNIGKLHGYELDQGHIRELLATMGVGMGSQYLEQFGRKLFGGLLGSIAGGLGRGLGSEAAGMAFSFASTYALGQVARRYYGGGRQMSTALLKDTFNELLGPAKQLQTQYVGQIREKAGTLDMAQIMSSIRGS